jgi:hypothetical protein
VEEKRQKTNRPEDDMNAYNILSRRHLNDDRLMGERSSIFLASSSILFVGFVMLPSNAWILRIIVCFLGLLLSIFAIMSNYRTSRGLDFWDEKEKEIEQEGQSFAYMRERKMMPHLVYKGGLRNRHIYTYILPSIFIILWISSFVWVICSK